MADLYVSPRGLDTNTGFSPDQPLRTIQRAIDIVAVPERDVVVAVEEGEYEGGLKADADASMIIGPNKITFPKKK